MAFKSLFYFRSEVDGLGIESAGQRANTGDANQTHWASKCKYAVSGKSGEFSSHYLESL